MAAIRLQEALVGGQSFGLVCRFQAAAKPFQTSPRRGERLTDAR